MAKLSTYITCKSCIPWKKRRETCSLNIMIEFYYVRNVNLRYSLSENTSKVKKGGAHKEISIRKFASSSTSTHFYNILTLTINYVGYKKILVKYLLKSVEKL